MANVSRDVVDKADESAKRAKQMSEGVQFAIVKVLPNIGNGAFWGFTTVKEAQSKWKAITEAAPNIIARKLGDNCLIEVAPQYLLSSVQIIDPQAVTQEDLNDIMKAKAEAHVAFERFLISRGKEVAKTGKLFRGTIGIYCTNDVTSIASKGVNYPAFRLNMADVLNYLSNYGYKIEVGGQMVAPQQAANAGSALWDSCILSPTKTGIFITIESTLNADAIKKLEVQFRQRTGAKK